MAMSTIETRAAPKITVRARSSETRSRSGSKTSRHCDPLEMNRLAAWT